MTEVFVSYKREDETRVALVVKTLESAGLSVWSDCGISGGEEWRANIERHSIRRSRWWCA